MNEGLVKVPTSKYSMVEKEDGFNERVDTDLLVEILEEGGVSFDEATEEVYASPEVAAEWADLLDRAHEIDRWCVRTGKDEAISDHIEAKEVHTLRDCVMAAEQYIKENP